MKINRIEIKNFGTLSETTIDLKDGVNYICEDNGSGKTTLGAFIKVMFYSFDKEKSKINERERTKYKPWQGGIYGGTIEFEANEKEYILTRRFGDKSADDESSLRDKKTKVETKDFDINKLGKELFDIDAGSFARTMFLSQNEYDLDSFNDIDSKIGNLIDNTDDMNNFESAKDSLETKINELSKKRSPYGIIERNEEKIKNLEQDIKAIPSIEESIHRLTIDLDEENDIIADKVKEKNDIDSKLQEIGNKKDSAAKKKEYEMLVKESNLETDKLSRLIDYFNGQEPISAEISSCEEKLTELEKNNALLQENYLSDDDKIMRVKLNNSFNKIGIHSNDFDEFKKILSNQTKIKNEINNLSLSEDEIRTLNEESKIFPSNYNKEVTQNYIELWTGEREEKRNRVNSLSLSFTESEHLNELEKEFAEKSLNVNEIENCIHNLLSEETNNEISELKNSLAIEESSEKSKFNLIGFIAMTLLLILGAVLIIMFNKVVIGAAFIVIGILIMIISTLINNSKLNTERNNKIQEINTKIDLLETKKVDAKNNAINLLTKYDAYKNNGNLVISLNDLTGRYKTYVDLHEKSIKQKEMQDQFVSRINEIENEVFNYLKQFNVDANENNALPKLHELQNRYDNYIKLKSKNDSKDLSDYMKLYTDNENIINSFFKKFELSNIKEEERFEVTDKLRNSFNLMTDLNNKSETYDKLSCKKDELNKDILNIFTKYGMVGEFDWKLKINEMQNQDVLYKQAKDMCIQTHDKLVKFESENPNYKTFANIDESVDNISLEELTNKSVALQKEIDDEKANKDRISSCLTEQNDLYNELCDKKGEINLLENENNELSERLRILTFAKNLLVSAKESLNSKYGAPIEDSLKKYFDVLAKDANFDISINANKELILTAQGSERDLRNLSKGYSDIVDICFRMSLTDAMYTSEKPLIILDDPFINLDESKVESGLKFLNTIGKDYQVLYLTCHQSRMPIK